MDVDICPFCGSGRILLASEGSDEYWECLECDNEWHTYQQLKEREEARRNRDKRTIQRLGEE